MKLSKFYKFRCLFIILLSIGFALQTYGQGIIKGTVTDAADGSAIIGATIFISSINTGATTDVNGDYKLEVPAGNYGLSVSFIGYKRMQQTVQVSDGETVTLDFSLESDILSLDEVIVTATNTARTQSEAPLSITRMKSQELTRLSASSQADILRTVPGITAEGGGGEVASNVFVRGLPSGGQYQFTPLQVDGIPILSAFGLNSSAHDVYFRTDVGIESLEFVRGGVSTLFGAGSVAGIINYISKTGGATPENIVQLEWADESRFKADFFSSGPLGNENSNTFYAFSGFYRFDEGPLDTGLPTEGVQLRGNLKKVFDDGSGEFRVYGQYIDDKVQFYLPLPLEGNSRERAIGNDGDEVFTAQTVHAADIRYQTPDGVFQSPIRDGVLTKGGLLMAHLEKELGEGLTLNSKVKFARYNHQFNLFLDGDGQVNAPETLAGFLATRELPGTDSATFTFSDSGQPLPDDALLFGNRVLDRDRPMNELVGEFNLTKRIEGAMTHNITIGAFLSRTEATDFNVVTRYLAEFNDKPRTVDLTFVDVDGIEKTYSLNGLTGNAGYTNRFNTASKIAAYLTDEIKGENIFIDVGVRVEKLVGDFNQEGTRSFLIDDSNTLAPNLQSVTWGNGDWLRGRVDATEVAVAGAALYKLNQTTGVYINGSTGYFFPEIRSVRFNSLGQPQSYEGERINQGEAGIKIGSESINASGAVYWVQLKDRRQTDFVNAPDGSITEVVNIQDTRTVGVEGNLTYLFTPSLRFQGNFTFQDHEITENEANEAQVGNELRRQPNFMYSAGVYFDNKAIDISLSNTFTSDKFTDDNNAVELDGFNIARVNAGYTFSLGEDESLRLGVSVFNLFESEGVTEGSPRQGATQTGTGDFFVGRPILPRRVFIRAEFNF